MTTSTTRRRTTVAAMLTLGLGLGAALSACTSATGTASTTATTRHTTTAVPGTAGGAASTALEPERDVTVTGRHFKARCAGTGPSVVLVADYGQSMDEAWDTLPQTLASSGRVCVYDRLGVGRSDPPPERQTFATLAADLDGLISALGLTRPVVAVGRSMGAPIVLSWASSHRSDARAVVLLDPMPPGYFGPDGIFVKLLPPKDPGDPELGNLWADLDRFNDPATNRESLDPRSWTTYARLAPTSVPLYDLVEAQSQPQSWPAAVDARKVEAAWRASQRRVLALSSASEMVGVPTADDVPSAIRMTLDRALRP
ncbi:alpha/beta hydrolase [Terrabacter carboxydivorans]|uniref:AB hydrolase-1 domain-containing protein n=1 Tax=Terrabacter carboxydivorans TaxID=619730 RepID=A0ABP5YSW2_9MICO